MTDKEIDIAAELLNELESQVFLEGKKRCTNCGLLEDVDGLTDGICSDCIPRVAFNAEYAKRPKYYKKEVSNE